ARRAGPRAGRTAGAAGPAARVPTGTPLLTAIAAIGQSTRAGAAGLVAGGTGSSRAHFLTISMLCSSTAVLHATITWHTWNCAWPNATPLRNARCSGVTASRNFCVDPVHDPICWVIEPLAMWPPTFSVTVTLRDATEPGWHVIRTVGKITAPLASSVAFLPSDTAATGGDCDCTLTEAPAGSANASIAPAAMAAPAISGKRAHLTFIPPLSHVD